MATRVTLLILLVLAIAACGGSERSAGSAAIADRFAVQDTVNRLFIKTDEKDWPAVQKVFAPEVLFDMTSLAGGQPGRLTPQQIADAWDKGLKDVAKVHHQTGNLLVTLKGDQAEVFCYGTATHYRPGAAKKVTTFVGSYAFRLVRTGGEWRIDQFKFNSKYVD